MITPALVATLVLHPDKGGFLAHETRWLPFAFLLSLMIPIKDFGLFGQAFGTLFSLFLFSMTAYLMQTQRREKFMEAEKYCE